MNNLTKVMMMDHNMSAKTVMNRIVAEVDASFIDEITLLMRKLLCWYELACSSGACWCASSLNTHVRSFSVLENHWVSKYKSASTTCAFLIDLLPMQFHLAYTMVSIPVLLGHHNPSGVVPLSDSKQALSKELF
jgi:hypothetical protein